MGFHRKAGALLLGIPLALGLAIPWSSCSDGRGGKSRKDTAPPTISIETPTTAPTFDATTSPLALGGTASDDTGVTEVTWANPSVGGGGAASGTTAWTASIPLAPGPNPITVTARDAVGNTAVDSITVDLQVQVFAWGSNGYTQLGDGSIAVTDDPVQVVDPADPSGLLQNAIAVTGSWFHALVVLGDGTVRGWGSNSVGQLGDGTTVSTLTPVQAVDPADPSGHLRNVTAISTANGHTVALIADGTVRCWGRNDYGRLGDGTLTASPSPVQVVDPTDPTGFLQGAVAVAAGRDFSLAVLGDGTVRAWGRGRRLGTAAGLDSSTPVQVEDPSDPTGFLQDVVTVSAGESHAMALTSTGIVNTWGTNQEGQLGDGTTILAQTPVQVVDPFDPSGFLQNVTAIVAGDYHSMALLSNGTVRSWGDQFELQLGVQGFSDMTMPVQVEDLSDPSGYLTGVTAIGAAGYTSMAMKGTGGLWVWGKLADQTAMQKSDPADPIGMLTGVIAAGGGFRSVSVVKADGTGWSWGVNDFGQLGDGTTSAPKLRPVPVLDPSSPSGSLFGAIEVLADYKFSAALLADGTVRTWGDNEHGQLGDGTLEARNVAVQVIDPADPSGLLTDVVDLAQAFVVSVAVRGDGTVRAWGENYLGQMAIGPVPSTSVPLPILDPSDPAGVLTDVIGVSTASIQGLFDRSIHTVALKGDGTVRAWGYNLYGGLGDGTQTDSTVPVQTIDPNDPTGYLTGVIAVEAGRQYSLALKADGTVWSWGGNFRGMLGDGTQNPSSVPIQVIDPADPTGYLRGVTAISAGQLHSAALKGDGTIRTWGINTNGELGDGTAVERWSPVQVVDPADPTGFLTNVRMVDAGLWVSIAVLNDGTVRTWGSNVTGQLGDGTTTDSLVPVQVIDPDDPTGFLTGIASASAGSHHAVATR